MLDHHDMQAVAGQYPARPRNTILLKQKKCCTGDKYWHYRESSMLGKRVAVEPTIPTKCYEHFHLTMSEYALYDVACAWSAKTGLLFFDGQKLSRQYKHAKNR
jgi:hypothetical protein